LSKKLYNDDEFFAEPFLRDIPVGEENFSENCKADLVRIKLLAKQIYDKRVLLQQNYGVVLDAQLTLVARIAFITQAVFGATTSERLHLEHEWLKNHILASLEQAHNQKASEQRAQKLHLPQGGIRLVKPLENGQADEYKPETN